MRMTSNLLPLFYVCFLATYVTEAVLDIFSQDVKAECDKARLGLLSSTDRIMKNWKVGDGKVKKMVFEGDMIVTAEQKARYTQTGYIADNTMELLETKWASNTVTYEFGTPAPTDKSMITDAMKAWSDKTCIKFSEGTSSAIKIIKGDGCYATLGFQASDMQMSVADICDKGVVVHLLGHVIGLVHQHSRPDRNLFLNIQYHNTAIEDVLFLNFKGYDLCKYDYLSAMQYDMYGLSYNGESVFLGRPQDQRNDGIMFSSAIGRDWTKPSDSDAALVNKEYGCAEKSCGDQDTDAIKQPPCNQAAVATQQSFEKNVVFSSIIKDEGRVIQCIWKMEVPETLTCSRAALAVTLSANPSLDLKRAWFASGCRLFQVEIFDPVADMSYFYCAAQFARKPSKVFVGTSRLIYAIAKMYPAKWNGVTESALASGAVKFFNIKDFVCAGEINGKCY